jgi:hypothetical protein
MGAVVRAARDILDRAGVRPDTHSTADVRRLLRTFVAVVMANVSDLQEQATIARELRRLSLRDGLPDLAQDIPVPAPPERRHPAPPELEAPTEPVSTEVVL